MSGCNKSPYREGNLSEQRNEGVFPWKDESGNSLVVEENERSKYDITESEEEYLRTFDINDESKWNEAFTIIDKQINLIAPSFFQGLDSDTQADICSYTLIDLYNGQLCTWRNKDIRIKFIAFLRTWLKRNRSRVLTKRMFIASIPLRQQNYISKINKCSEKYNIPIDESYLPVYAQYLGITLEETLGAINLIKIIDNFKNTGTDYTNRKAEIL